MVSYEPHLAGVRGTSSCSCQGLVVSYWYLLAVATGWWSAMNTFFERTLSQRFREKEQRLVFIHALIHLPAIKALAVWIYLPQLRGFWFSFDQRSKSQHNCCHNGNTKFPLNIVEQNHQRVTPFSLGTQNLNDTPWSTMAVTLSVPLVKSNRAISRAIFQHKQLNWQAIFFHGGLHWLWCRIVVSPGFHTSHSHGKQL